MPQIVKALSIKQPWAWLIVNGYKDVENRTWALPRSFELPQRIYVHAGQTWDRDAYPAVSRAIEATGDTEVFALGWDGMRMALRRGKFFGAIVGEVTITDLLSPCAPNGLEDEQADSPWYEGDYGFVLSNHVAYDEPIPCKGRLGFWTPREMEA